MKTLRLATTLLVLVSLFILGCRRGPKEVERPERIHSLREVIYDSSTYAKLAGLWKNYYDAYPSEDAYANWIYAARYASNPDYPSLLQRGLEIYPSNPVILYLAGNEKCSHQDNLEGLQLLEKAAAFDPSYMDTWHSLVVAYCSQGDREKADAALRRLLEGGAVQDEIMDFSYNMIASTDTGAILITNGDNDTFPGWILTRIIRFRPDVNIVNRALLNTDWYPSAIVKEGVPPFITQSEMDSLKAAVVSDIKKASDRFVLLGDRLLVWIINAAERVGRPVYFTCTLESVAIVRRFRAEGWKLGLVTLVTPTSQPYSAQLQKLFRVWGSDFRTGGLDSWRLHAAKETSAGRMLIKNYGGALHSLKDRIREAGPAVQLSLFHWYRNHLIDLLPAEQLDETNRIWCSTNSPPEIRAWCKRLGLAE
jgi:tetratricopeptide (TPR) repeat protein